MDREGIRIKIIQGGQITYPYTMVPYVYISAWVSSQQAYFSTFSAQQQEIYTLTITALTVDLLRNSFFYDYAGSVHTVAKILYDTKSTLVFYLNQISVSANNLYYSFSLYVPSYLSSISSYLGSLHSEVLLLRINEFNIFSNYLLPCLSDIRSILSWSLPTIAERIFDLSAYINIIASSINATGYNIFRFLSDIHIALSYEIAPVLRELSYYALQFYRATCYISDYPYTALAVYIPTLPPVTISLSPAIFSEGGAELFAKEITYYASPEQKKSSFFSLLDNLATGPLKEFFSTLAKPIDKIAAPLLSEVQKTANAIAQKIEIAPTAIAGEIQKIFEPMFQIFYDGLIQMIKKAVPITPESAPAVASDLYLFAAGAGSAAHFASIGLELLQPLKNLGLYAIPALLGDMANFGGISNATIGAIISSALKRPYQYWADKEFRTNIPGARDLQNLAIERCITLPEFQTAMTYHGYSDTWIRATQKMMWYDPSYRELTLFAEDSSSTDAWLYKKAQYRGYDDEDSYILAKSIIRRMLSKQRSSYFSAAEKLYEKGFITEFQFDSYLRELNLRYEAHDLAKKAAKLNFLYTYTSDMIKIYQEKFVKEIITEGELWVSLAALGLDSAKINLLIQFSKLDKTPKPRQPVKTEVEKQTAEIQTKYIQLYTELFRKDVIDRDTFFSNLISVGIIPALAEITASLEDAKKIKPTKIGTEVGLTAEEKRILSLYKDLYLTQFRKGLTSAGQLEEELAALGLSPEESALTVELELLRQTPTTAH